MTDHPPRTVTPSSRPEDSNRAPAAGWVPPFAYSVSPLDEPTLHETDAFFRTWSQEFGFPENAYTRSASAYLKYCCPQTRSLSATLLAAEYLAWYLSLNDLEPSDHKRDILRSSAQALTVPISSDAPELRAGAAFLRNLEAQVGGEALDRFKWRTEQMLTSFLWELDAMQEEQPPTTREYLHHRLHLIGHLPYVEMWRLLTEAAEGSEVPPKPLDDLELHNTRIIFTTNDIMSVARDARLQKLNLVFCLAKENNLKIPDALPRAHEYLTQELTTYRTLRTALSLAHSNHRALNTHLDFLDSVIEGNRLGVVALGERYLLPH